MKYRIICLILSVFMLSACTKSGSTCDTSETTAAGFEKTAETTTAEKINYITLTSTTSCIPPENTLSFDFNTIENFSDDYFLQLTEGIYTSKDFIADYTVIDDFGIPFSGQYDRMFVPVDENFESYSSDEKQFPSYYVDKYENLVLEKIGENELYSEWSNTYTEIRTYTNNGVLTENHIDRYYRRLFFKNFRRISAEGKIVYTGEMNAQSIQNNFDILNPVTKLCRRVRETDEHFIYEYYCYYIVGGDYGLYDQLVIEKCEISISKTDGRFNDAFVTFEKRIDIPGTYNYEDDIEY